MVGRMCFLNFVVKGWTTEYPTAEMYILRITPEIKKYILQNHQKINL